MSNSNTGGRVSFTIDDEVKILELDGRVSDDIYIIKQNRSDRKGHLLLIHKLTEAIRKVHHRRVLPKGYEDGMATVLEVSNRFYALCPKCGKKEEILPTRDDLQCPDCGRFNLFWISDKPDIEVYKTKKLSIRKPKEMTKQTKIDLDAISKLPDCELWSKIVSFDHEKIDVRAHVLILTTEPHRKYCFNTYDGILGKKTSKLYIEDFMKGFIGYEGVRWFSISDIEKARKKLIKTGYELHKEVK